MLILIDFNPLAILKKTVKIKYDKLNKYFRKG